MLAELSMASIPNCSRRMHLAQLWRALRSRNYRLFFGGQGISLIGTWMQRIALSWLVYRLTGSAMMLGAVGFASQVPTFLLAPLAGVLSDRWNLRKVLVVTQVLAMVQALALAVLTLTDTVAVWHVFALGIALGAINGFDVPARQTFVVQMVPKVEDVPNAIALNSLLVNSARLIGPSLAGILIGLVGEGVCFLANGLSYVAVVAALLAMQLPARRARPPQTHVLRDLTQGFRYAFGFAPIRGVLLLLALVSLVGMTYVVLMPIFATDVLHGGPHTLGFLMAAAGGGAVAGAFYLAGRQSVVGLGDTITRATLLLGAGLAVLSWARLEWLALGLMVVIGFAAMLQLAASNTVLQTIVEDHMRGRVMSFYTMAFMGMAPLSSLLAGALANWVGTTPALLLSGIVCMVGAAVSALQLPALRALAWPVYVRKGLIADVAGAAPADAHGATLIAAPPADR